MNTPIRLAKLLSEALSAILGGRYRNTFSIGTLCGFSCYLLISTLLSAQGIPEPPLLSIATTLGVAAAITAPRVIIEERYPPRYREQVIALRELLRTLPRTISETQKAEVMMKLADAIAEERVCAEYPVLAVCKIGDDGAGRRLRRGEPFIPPPSS